MKRSFKTTHILFFTALGLFTGSIYYACQDRAGAPDPPPFSHLPSTFVSDQDFVGSEKCMDCHQGEYQLWQGSHHDLAMQTANEQTVLGDFTGVSYVTNEGMKSYFYRKGEEFWVNTEGPDGTYQDYKVVYTYGVEPLQQYIVAFPGGKYQCLSTAWDTEEKKWFDLYPDLKVVHEEWLHWSRGAMNWNTMCSDCHSTNVKKNFNEKEDSYHTTYALINVSCEACHGPGKEHMQTVTDPSYEKGSSPGIKFMTNITQPKELVDACGRCHIRREQLTLAYNWQGDLMDHYYPQLLTERVYHADGQILDEVYVWGSFVQSKMYMNNVTCTDCHDAHSLELKATGNSLCINCHEAPKYDVLEHVRHKPGSEGASCINCHMPGKYYMVNDFRRDHSFRVPRPDLSVEYGTPNACTMCHEDKDDQWALEAFINWYGEPNDDHFSKALAMGRAGDTSAIAMLHQLVSDPGEPPIARATGVVYLSRYQDENTIKGILKYLEDEAPLVRAATTDALDQIAPLYFTQYLFKGLADESCAVRIKTFEALAGLPLDQIPAEYSTAYQKSKREFYQYLMATADFPGGQAHKALYYQKIGQVDSAIMAYERAVSMDNYNNMSRINLANLYYQKGSVQKAEDTFKKVIEQEPGFAGTYYSLGLLYAEQNRTAEAIQQLEHALTLQKDNARVFYNLGLLYQNQQEVTKAETTFEEGLQFHPQDEGLLYAMVFLQSTKKSNPDKAKQYARRLIQLFPNNPNYQQLWSQLTDERVNP